MIRAHTVEQVRAAEQQAMARLPDGALMQRAAHGLAAALVELLAASGPVTGRRVLLVVGSGDNGGDALYAGAVLARRGVAVSAWSLTGDPHAAGLAALLAAGGRRVDGAPSTSAPSTWPDLVVDGVVGIGGRPGLRPDAEAAYAGLARLGDPAVVAVDVPSGVGVDTGELDGPHVQALATVTFGTHKIAHLVDPAASAAGAVHLVDLGLDLPEPAIEALQPDDVRRLLRQPGGTSQKYTRGVVGVRAGSAQYPGAGMLSVGGAACGLAGMVRYVGDDEVVRLVHAAHPEVVAGTGRVQAWVVGSGSGQESAASLEDALGDGVPVVVDADALAHAPRRHDTPRILTPHAGELARLLDTDRAEVEARPLHHVRRAVEAYDAVVLLKGRRTLVAAPDGRVRVNTTGTPWLATAGAGDVLGGLIAALAASGLTPLDAASVGAWLHGAAATTASSDADGPSGGPSDGPSDGPGDGPSDVHSDGHRVGSRPIVAGDVARALPRTIGALLGD